MTLEVMAIAPTSALAPKSLRVTSNPVAHYLAKLEAKNSQATMRSALASVLCVMDRKKPIRSVDAEASRYYNKLIWTFPWHELENAWLVEAMQRMIQVGYSARTRRRLLVAIRGVLKSCRSLKLIDGEDFFSVFDGIKQPKVDADPQGRRVSDDEIIALLAACDADDTPRGIRDAALISIGWQTGLRAQEMADLRLEDWRRKEGQLFIAHGKGGKSRTVEVVGFPRERLEKWLTLRGAAPGHLWYGSDAGGQVMIRDLKAPKVQHGSKLRYQRKSRPIVRGDCLGPILYGRMNQAKLEPLTWHDLRRTMVTDLIKSHGVGVAKEAAGHKSEVTTLSYNRLDKTEVRNAISERTARLSDLLTKPTSTG